MLAATEPNLPAFLKTSSSSSDTATTARKLFPYQPYPIQVEFTEKCTSMLVKGRSEHEDGATVGIYESPTGTGKTTSLLCSTLAWLLTDEKNIRNIRSDSSEPEWIKRARLEQSAVQETKVENKRPLRQKAGADEEDPVAKLLKIINNDRQNERVKTSTHVPPTKRVFYASRTHSQLAQVMGELKKIIEHSGSTLPGIERIRAVSLSSRKSLCINKDIVKLGLPDAINDGCRDLLEKDCGCPFWNQDKSTDDMLDRHLKKDSELAVADIEELVKQGNQFSLCPYFSVKKLASYVNLITLPFNMLLDAKVRESFEINLEGSVVIFDEAHNLVNMINEMNSTKVSVSDLRLFADLLTRYIDRYERRFSSSNYVILQQLSVLVNRLMGWLKDETHWSQSFTINQLLLQTELDNINMLKVADYLEGSKLQHKLHQFAPEVDAVVDLPSGFVSDTLTKVLRALAECSSNGRIIVDEAGLKYIALSPAETMKDVVTRCHSVILAGGTMKPIDDVILQLFEKDSVLENVEFHSFGHVIPADAVMVSSLGSGPTGLPLSFTHSNRGDQAIYAELAQVISNVCNVTPDGVVCFFASYKLLESFLNNFPTKTRESIEAKKHIFIDSANQSQSACEKMLINYRHEIFTKNGALLFAVIGGRLSEGINFADRLCRTLLVVGMPYANANDAEVKVRLEHYASMHPSHDSQELLENQCMRAVNQTIGRAIRHAKDWSSILLIDARYSAHNHRIRRKLPDWIQTSLDSDNPTDDFAKVFTRLVKFQRSRKQQ